jgi:DNA-binding NtrC family response regulator
MFDGLTVLYIEDDDSIRHSIAQSLQLAGLSVTALRCAEDALPLLQRGFCGIMITDVQLPNMSGLQLMRAVQDSACNCPVILVTGHGDIDMAVQAMRDGAYDFIEKPFDSERLIEVACRALEKCTLTQTISSLRKQLHEQRGIDSVLLGNSLPIQQLREQVLQLASTPTDVMIMGETGTGKELVARCLHDYGSRKDKHFVALNCGGIPENLLESELFGHEAGAFTTANKQRVGKLEYANRGTLFLDEIESMPMTIQIKLLRVLQERKIERLGSNEQIPIQIRVVAAAKEDLLAMSQQQRFRADLYYRLNVAVLHLPPLRERKSDIPLLFEAFVQQAAAKLDRTPPEVTGQHLQSLMAHDWPGNVRELRNIAERFALGLVHANSQWMPTHCPSPLTLAAQMDMVEKVLIEQMLKTHEGRPQAVYEALGISKKTFYDKVHKHHIALDTFRTIKTIK